jgi:thiosulfate/3-mercaptopyruvate sulfurtransferase
MILRMADTSSLEPQSAVPSLIGSEWLALQLRSSGTGTALRVVDVRQPPKAAEKYREAHIPGAVRADLDADLAQPGGPGRHPFPPVEAFARLLGRLGIGAQTHVVVYDDGQGAYAARLWYMLRVHGLARASLLEGGLAGWRAAGHPVASDEEQATPVEPPKLTLDRSMLVDRAQLKQILRSSSALVFDARARPRYRGDVEPFDAKKGHIPGVVNAPYEENFASPAEGRFKPPAELRAAFEKLGASASREVVVSCGSGVTACHDALALERAGLPLPRLYVGSFSDWASSDEPVATGDEPGKLE